MKTIFSILMLTCFIAVVHSRIIRFKNCKSDYKAILSVPSAGVRIEPCPNSNENRNPCHVNKGKSTTISIDFTPKTEIKSLNLTITAMLGSVEHDFIENKDVSEESDLEFPLVVGEPYTYSYSLVIPEEAPAIKTIIKLQLVDQNAEKQVCIMFPAKVTDEW